MSKKNNFKNKDEFVAKAKKVHKKRLEDQADEETLEELKNALNSGSNNILSG